MDQILSYLAEYSPTGYLAMISDEFYIQLIPNHALAKKGNDALNLSSELPVKFP